MLVCLLVLVCMCALSSFLELARELSHDSELKQFFDQWVYCDGSARVRVDFRFNKKKHQTDLMVTQEQVQKDNTPLSSWANNTHTTADGLSLHFTGALLFRIHEVERVTEQERRIEADKQLVTRTPRCNHAARALRADDAAFVHHVHASCHDASLTVAGCCFPGWLRCVVLLCALLLCSVLVCCSVVLVCVSLV